MKFTWFTYRAAIKKKKRRIQYCLDMAYGAKVMFGEKSRSAPAMKLEAQKELKTMKLLMDRFSERFVK